MDSLTYNRIGTFDSEKVINEVEHLFDSNYHVSLQKRRKPLYDLPYTNQLLDQYSLYNCRIMKLVGKECYTWHRDQTPRVHLPLITNSNCLFVLEDKAFKMPAGEVWWVDTTKTHTAFNGNRPEYIRYHIVGMTDEAF